MATRGQHCFVVVVVGVSVVGFLAPVEWFINAALVVVCFFGGGVLLTVDTVVDLVCFSFLLCVFLCPLARETLDFGRLLHAHREVPSQTPSCVR